MTAAVGFALLKVLLGLAVFVVLGYLGKFYDKRIAGVLLTFPILNGIGILAGHDPLAVADSIYAVVVFNGLLLFLMISFCTELPPMPRTSLTVKLVTRLLVWTAVWAIIAPLIVIFREALPGAPGLLLIAAAIAAVAARFFWRAPREATRAERAVPHLGTGDHVRAMIMLWRNPAGLFRIGLFVFSCVLLLAAAQLYPSKWVGMISALPLPGLFAVATLSVLEERKDFALMRDSVLLGPVTVLAFNWLYAHVVTHLPAGIPARTELGIAALVVLLLADAILIFWIVPTISAYLDRARKMTAH